MLFRISFISINFVSEKIKYRLTVLGLYLKICPYMFGALVHFQDTPMRPRRASAKLRPPKVRSLCKSNYTTSPDRFVCSLVYGPVDTQWWLNVDDQYYVEIVYAVCQLGTGMICLSIIQSYKTSRSYSSMHFC